MHPQEEGEYNLDKNSPCPLNGKVKLGKVRPELSWTTYYSPGKTKYRSAPEVEKVLHERGMRLCFQDESSESDGYHATESDNEEKLPSTSKVLKNSHHEVEQRLCVCESTQICKFVEDINKSSRCSTEECDGMFFCF